MKKAIIILLSAVIVCGIIDVSLYSRNDLKAAAHYNVFVYNDGSAKIEVKNVNYIHQAKDGTITVEGGGIAPEYQYSQRQFVKEGEK